MLKGEFDMWIAASTLPETNSKKHLKIGQVPRKERQTSPFPSKFLGTKLLASGS